jgi:uncharacterized protein YkwD
LRLDSALSKAAREHARDMVRRRYFDHYSPQGKGFMSWALGAGYGHGARIRVGENILFSTARVTPSEVMRDWMGSPAHRRDILRAGWKDVGIGAAGLSPFGGRGITLVVLFGARCRGR